MSDVVQYEPMESDITAPAEIDVVTAVDVPAFYQNASGLSITPEEQTALLADFDENEIEIRPDGLIYLPQSFFRSRLNQVFGIGQWALIQHRTHMDANYLYFDGSLYVRGCFVARAMGEAQKQANNKMQSWAGVYESAKSDCIVRCCKDLSIAAKLWQPAFGRRWIESNAVKIWRDYKEPDRNGNKGRYEWRRKDAPPFWWEKGNKGAQADECPEPTPTPTPAEKTPENRPTLMYRGSETVIPVGKSKGKKFSELRVDELESIRDGARATGKYDDLVECIETYLSEAPSFLTDGVI